MKKVFQYIKEIFSSPNNRLSSKRISGFMGWCVVLWALIYCTIHNTQAPEITEYVAVVSAALMGLGILDKYNWNKPTQQ